VDTNIGISSFGVDQNNELLICSLYDGGIYRFISDEPGGMGDLNQDNTVNVLDIIQTVNIILGQTPADDYQQWAGNLNMDGNIDFCGWEYCDCVIE
jgi:hypothetical protein